MEARHGMSFPNLPLMKLSAWHKQRGDDVEWYFPFGEKYNTVYISKVFSFTPDYLDVVNADKIIRRGSGYAIYLQDGKEVYDKEADKNLPDVIEHIFPDYSLYPELTKDTAFGYLTRGCPRRCEFCHVATKEGAYSVKVADLSEFWNGQKNIVLLDPNILACKDWRMLLTQLINSGAKVNFTQGLDVRLMTKEKAQMLSEIRMKNIHFAWDRYQDKNSVLRGLKLFSQHSKIRLKDIVVYVIVNFDTTLELDLERIYTLRNLGFYPYVMIYNKEHALPVYKHLARWCNNRIIFATCDNFDNYYIKTYERVERK